MPIPLTDPFMNNSYVNWSLPAKYVNEAWQHYEHVNDTGSWSPTAGGWVPYGSVNYRINTNLLKGFNTQCWYVNTPGGTVRANGRLYFSNGQDVNVAALGQISIYRPSVWFTNLLTSGPSNFTISDETWLRCLLKLGDQHGNGAMEVGAGINSKYTGHIGLTQLITADYSSPGLRFSTERCDGSEFYAGPNYVAAVTNPALPSGQAFFTDGPDEYCASPNIVSISARDFVRFQPDGGIWVTLGIISWDAVGIAEQDTFGFAWKLTANAITGPNGPNSSDEFPVWTINQPSPDD